MLTCKNNKIAVFAFLLGLFACAQAQPLCVKPYSSVSTGSMKFQSYLPLLKNKRVAVLTNATGQISGKSIVDTLIALKVDVKKILGPEHGFRGATEAGEKVSSGFDAKTGLPVISLYGANKKPAKEQLRDVDVVIYDIQDIGVRFYTYISTMCYAMEACAENKKEFIVLDRPNPNGFYIDGPVLQNEFKGFLGLHNVPLVYGMTCGEYALMANSEGWLKNRVKCRLTVIPMDHYDRKCAYELPVKPSPNLPDLRAILLYPATGLFEGTLMSLGRGTFHPFLCIGHPQWPDTLFCFTPRETEIAKNPKYKDQRCCGIDLRTCDTGTHPRQIRISLVLEAFAKMPRDDFFDRNFNYHSGNQVLQTQIRQGKPEAEIRESWAADIAAFKKIRRKYLLYPDF